MHVIVYFMSTSRCTFTTCIEKSMFLPSKRDRFRPVKIVFMTFPFLFCPSLFLLRRRSDHQRERESLSDRGEKEDRGEGKKVSLPPSAKASISARARDRPMQV